MKRRPAVAVSEGSMDADLCDLRVTIGNDTIKHNLMQIGRLQLQHLMNTSSANSIRRDLQLHTGTVRSTEAGANEVLTMLVEQIESLSMSA